jgi:hypothetical protein
MLSMCRSFTAEQCTPLLLTDHATCESQGIAGFRMAGGPSILAISDISVNLESLGGWHLPPGARLIRSIAGTECHCGSYPTKTEIEQLSKKAGPASARVQYARLLGQISQPRNSVVAWFTAACPLGSEHCVLSGSSFFGVFSLRCCAQRSNEAMKTLREKISGQAFLLPSVDSIVSDNQLTKFRRFRDKLKCSGRYRCWCEAV